MASPSDNLWQSPLASQLSYILAAIDNQQTMEKFLRDVLTEKEITEIAARLEAARMLNQGKKYTEITQVTKLSSRTVARISEWLQKDTEGYQDALGILEVHHTHTPPARA